MLNKFFSCCKKLDNNLKNYKVPLKYFLQRRTYSIGRRHYLILIKHCPWCGEKLPYSLRDILYETLKKIYPDSDPFREQDEDPNFPEEFKTDKWWKKRGL